MLRDYLLTLECGHQLKEQSDTEWQGKDYFPDYRKRAVQCRESGCRKWTTVKDQDPLPPEA